MHRKLACIDGAIAFVGGINIIDDFDGPAERRRATTTRCASKVRSPPRCAARRPGCGAASPGRRCAAGRARCCAAPPVAAAGRQRPARRARHPRQLAPSPRHRECLSRADRGGAARRSSSPSPISFPAGASGAPWSRPRRAACAVRAAAAGQDRVPAAALRLARALRLAARRRHRDPRVPPQRAARQGGGVRRLRASVGSSNIDPFSLLLAREANVFVDDAAFAAELRRAWTRRSRRARAVPRAHWARLRCGEARIWLAYRLARLMMSFYGFEPAR